MKKLFLSILALTALGGFTQPAQAEIEHYQFDKTHSQIIFFVNHVGFSNSMGKFYGYDGDITYDTTNPEKSHVEVTIKTDSLSMGDDAWDTHMKGKDFFDVQKFPDMIFKSTDIKLTGENTADIHGELTILGVTKPVTLKTIHNKTGKNPFSGKYTIGLSATATIKRSEFGMLYGLPLVGDDVQIRIEVEANKREPNQ